jgi:MarC family membrane protein
MEIYTAAATLFLIMDPLGNIPVFLSILKDIDPKRRRIILIRELVFALIISLAFLFLGQYILDFLHLRQESISIAGGIILFLIAIRMIFPSKGGYTGDYANKEPFLVPLAVPLIAGPSTLAALSLLSRSEPGRIGDWTIALLIAWICAAIILLMSNLFYKIFRENGLTAIERLMGMLLVALSIQMLLDGVAVYLGK